MNNQKLKEIKIELKGESRILPFENLEEFNEKLVNKGYAQKLRENGIEVDYIVIYEYAGKLYEVEEIEHYNTTMLSAKLVEYKG